MRDLFVSISHQAACICIDLAHLYLGQDLGSEFRSKWVSGSDPNWESFDGSSQAEIVLPKRKKRKKCYVLKVKFSVELEASSGT